MSTDLAIEKSVGDALAAASAPASVRRQRLEAVIVALLATARGTCLDHTGRARADERLWIYKAIRVGRVNGLRSTEILARLEAICNPHDNRAVHDQIVTPSSS